MRHYDYIIAGTGCAGLSLAVHLIENGLTRDKKILLVDKAPKTTNDRTWCFWETKPGLFEPVVYKHWDTLSIHGDDFEKTEPIAPYTYKMIRSIDFYHYCRKKIEANLSFEWLFGTIENIQSTSDQTTIVVDKKTISADYIFSSILPDTSDLLKGALKGREYLLQHFKGWLIETEKSTFNPGTGTLMDFRVPQGLDTAFVYVLPLDTKNALIEFTVFSRIILKEEGYDNALRRYIAENLKADDYMIKEKESGIIPMTNFSFPYHQENIHYIGTAGGQTKPSTGYTFQFIQQRCAEIVFSLKQTGKPSQLRGNRANRFHFYDSVLLHILARRKMGGKEIFIRLFKKNKINAVLEFLEDRSSIYNDLKIIGALQKREFIKAALITIRNNIRYKSKKGT